VTKPDLEDVMSSLDIVSFMLVKANPGVSPDMLARRIESNVTKVSALPSHAFVANDRSMVMQMGVETIALMTTIGGSLAILLVAFTVYSQIARQQRELAVAKALGATNRMLLMSVTAQATAISVISVLVALLLAARSSGSQCWGSRWRWSHPWYRPGGSPALIRLRHFTARKYAQ
jgi:cell division protein FtsX